MTDVQQAGDIAGEQPPEGFTLDAEASRPDAVVPGIFEREIDLEPDDDDAAALEAIDDDAHADNGDDDVIDDPEEAGKTLGDV